MLSSFILSELHLSQRSLIMAPILSSTPLLALANILSSSFSGQTWPQKRADATKMPANVLDSTVSTQTDELQKESARERLIIMILVGTIVLSFVALLAYFIHRRFKLVVARKLLDDLEAGRKEVTEARAFRPQDDTLKEGYYTPFAAEDGNIYVRTPVLQTPARTHRSNSTPSVVLTRISVGTVPGVEPHPLFHPGIKRSRTLPTQKAPQYSNRAMRGAMSYPNIYDDQDQSLKSQPSSISLGSYYRAESKPMTPFSTMQTRRPETPPTDVDTPRRSAPPPPLSRKQIHSFWSVSDSASNAPSSPSLHSPGTYPRDLAPRPAPTLFGFGQVPCEDPATPHPGKPVPIGTPIRPIFSIDKDGTLPALSYPLPLLLRKSSSTLPRLQLPLSPPLSPRAVAPSAPPATSPLSQADEPPTAKIERWLSGSGSTGTASIIESVLNSNRRSSEPDIYRTDSPLRREKVTPIRSMRSSRRSSHSGEEIFIGAAF
ncbi:hypothetical protein ONS95_011691 [Cadophora gregata]|uniref:uncharacterized protein n=1 Tax=Cadophora gregata TaxID=51156 RepID=UPI0026DB4D97|nr:uncharacterized protein ONS95_011691 [Cadophora gregata]KAK0120285.1 hypothetical protein ONS95_011691 [Cadophora gregata]KAK0121317.1 hypothetical protein ONS96_011493 [Cadophora gregata f. sp. sojae]